MKKLVRETTSFSARIKVFIKDCPLIAALLLSTALLSIAALIGMTAGKYDWNISMNHPAFAAILAGEHKTEPKGGSLILKNIQMSEAPGLSDKENEKSTQQAIASDTKKEPDKHPTQYVPRTPAPPRSDYYNDPQCTALTTEYSYIQADDHYFDDALFIGDSRIEGMCFFSNLGGAEFCYKEGLTARKLFDEKIATKSSSFETVTDLLSNRQFKKIYMMLGINELGYDNQEKFAQKYAENLNVIRQLQPDCKIIILGIMNVTAEYSNKDNVFNNDNINARNVAISALADGVNTFYFDLNPVITDETGGICQGYTWDGIHLKAEYYHLCDEFLKARGIP